MDSQALYLGETVSLLCDLAEAGLPKDAEGNVVRVVRDELDAAVAAEVSFHSSSRVVVATVPLSALQAVVSRAGQDRTAVFWGMGSPPAQFLEAAMHSILDRGFAMAEGLNVARLYYDRAERCWKLGERTADSTGALAASASSWDGAIVALAGYQGFQLECRLRGRGEAALLLHEREVAYTEQTRSVEPAMSLLRVLLNLYVAAGAQCCAFPVAGPWLIDEDWQSLLRPPYFPDFFLLPQTSALEFQGPFRTARLQGSGSVVTVLPVKFTPHDEPPKRNARDYKMDSLRKLQALGEKYYDQLYETRSGTSGIYSDAKDAFIDAISLANELELKTEARLLEERLDHIKAVFRSQFS
jgi:hypothetical protein